MTRPRAQCFSSLLLCCAKLPVHLHPSPRGGQHGKSRDVPQYPPQPSLPSPPTAATCPAASRQLGFRCLKKKIQVSRRHDSQLCRCRLASSRKLLSVIAVSPSQVAERTGPPPLPRRRPEMEELQLANPHWAPPGRRRPAPPRCGSRRERTAVATLWQGRPTGRSPPHPRCSRC